MILNTLYIIGLAVCLPCSAIADILGRPYQYTSDLNDGSSLADTDDQIVVEVYSIKPQGQDIKYLRYQVPENQVDSGVSWETLDGVVTFVACAAKASEKNANMFKFVGDVCQVSQKAFEFLKWSCTTKRLQVYINQASTDVSGPDAGPCEGYHSLSTMCLPAVDCSAAHVGVCAVTSAEKTEILQVHNTLRQKVANGNELRGLPGPQPAGTNLYELEWSDELAAIAQRWAENTDGLKHDCNDCRNTSEFAVGQNMFMSMSSSTSTQKFYTWTEVTTSWYDEVEDLNSATFTTGNGKAVGHYTQVVWAKTHLIGCGVYGTNAEQCVTGFYCQIYVCNYAPAGNYIGQDPYSTTENCSHYSTNYPGLCTKETL